MAAAGLAPIGVAVHKMNSYGRRLDVLAERIVETMTGTTGQSVLTTTVACPRTGYDVTVNTPRGTVEGQPRPKAEWIADHNETVGLVEQDCQIQ